MSLYNCDGCNETIPAHKARIHCQQCLDYDVCANCYVLNIYTKGHTQAHSTRLEQRSGTSTAAPPLPVRPVAPTPTYNIGNPQGSTLYAGRNAPGSAGWTPLFNGSQVTRLGASFFSSIFTCLDTNNSGSLTPEQYSAFLDVLGYDLDGNVWKRNMKPHFGYNPEEIADLELRTSYENFSIDHNLQPRIIAPNRDFQNLMSSSNVSMPTMPALPPLSDGKMPMLTRQGFIDITTVEIVSDPSPGWLMMNRMARHYSVWRQWGDMPRNVLPEFPPQDLLNRIARITEFSRKQAADKIAAKRFEAEMQSQVNHNIQRLFDPPGTTYHYSYR